MPLYIANRLVDAAGRILLGKEQAIRLALACLLPAPAVFAQDRDDPIRAARDAFARAEQSGDDRDPPRCAVIALYLRFPGHGARC